MADKSHAENGGDLISVFGGPLDGKRFVATSDPPEGYRVKVILVEKHRRYVFIWQRIKDCLVDHAILQKLYKCSKETE